MRKKYKNPPLIEALCEFYFTPEMSQDFDRIIALFYEEVRTSFPKKDQLQLQASQITINNGGNAEITQQLLPIVRFQHNNGQVLIQVGQDLLTINHLKPYTSWEDFLLSVEMGLNAYRNVVRPKSSYRIALRYINRIEITGDRINLEDFFEFRPFTGQKLLQDFAAFSLGIQIPHEEARDILSVQLASVGSESPGTVVMVLDLTYSLVKPGGITFDNFSEWMTDAHSRIEDAFEDCITDRLRNLFGEEKEC